MVVCGAVFQVCDGATATAADAVGEPCGAKLWAMKYLFFAAAGMLVVAVSSVAPVRTAPAAVPTFSKDVAPIIFNKCASCHRPGEVAPMTLLSYEDVRPWAKVIRNKVASREMPPWGADPDHSLKMRNDRSLSKAQIDKIGRASCREKCRSRRS